MDNKNVFASNLKRHMEQAKKSRKEVADAIGVSYYTFTSWVTGQKYPRMDKVEMLAEYFGILKSDLIEMKTIESHPEETADFHAKILMDVDVQEMLEEYYSLSDNEQAIVKKFIHSLVSSD